jgi:hypothetical protein
MHILLSLMHSDFGFSLGSLSLTRTGRITILELWTDLSKSCFEMLSKYFNFKEMFIFNKDVVLLSGSSLHLEVEVV